MKLHYHKEIIRNGYHISSFTRKVPEKIISLKKEKNGYYRVALSKNSKVKFLWVHRLVAMAFIPNPMNKPCVNHKDNNPLNNKLDNLEWCTYKENTQYAAKQGRIIGRKGQPHKEETKRKISKSRVGYKQPASVVAKRVASWKESAVMNDEWKRKIGEANMLHGKKVRDIRTGKVYPSIRSCAKDIGVSEGILYRDVKQDVKNRRYIKYEE